jgi:hypothetical protein
VAGSGATVSPTEVITVAATQITPLPSLASVTGLAPVATGDALVAAMPARLGAIRIAPTVPAAPVRYFFIPPTFNMHYGEWVTARLTARIPYPTGGTVIKKAGFYTIDWGAPTQDVINAADVVYLGGHEYLISSDEAAALTAAGYGSNITAR